MGVSHEPSTLKKYSYRDWCNYEWIALGLHVSEPKTMKSIISVYEKS